MVLRYHSTRELLRIASTCVPRVLDRSFSVKALSWCTAANEPIKKPPAQPERMDEVSGDYNMNH